MQRCKIEHFIIYCQKSSIQRVKMHKENNQYISKRINVLKKKNNFQKNPYKKLISIGLIDLITISFVSRGIMHKKYLYRI